MGIETSDHAKTQEALDRAMRSLYERSREAMSPSELDELHARFTGTLRERA